MVGCHVSEESFINHYLLIYLIMRNIRLICCLLCSLMVLSLASCKKQQPQPQKLLFLAIGQSNMVGKGVIAPEDTIVSPRFLNLSATENPDRKIGEWRVALPGNCRPGFNYDNMLSPTDYFGRTVLEYLAPVDTVAILQVGVDGCPIRLFDKDQYKGFVDSCQMDWMKGQLAAYDGDPYSRLISLAKMAQAQGWTIRGLLVHQGETDAYSDYWPKELNKIYNNILTDLGLKAEDVPVLVGETVGIDQNGVCAHANPTLDRVHDFIPTAYTISSYGCKVSADNVHFAAEGYRKIGRRYAIKWLQLNGYQAEDDPEAKLQSEMGDPNDAFRVDAYIRQWDGKLMIASAESLASVDIVSFSGATLATIELNGAKTTELDITPYAGEDRLILNIRAANGAVVNKQVNNKKE